MKTGIHPTLNPVIFIDESTGDEIVTTSTLTSEETRDVDGVTYFIIRRDVTAYSHPFFTGEMRFVDSQGRVDKFRQKIQTASGKVGKKKKKLAKVSGDEAEDSKSYREILVEQQSNLRKSKQPAKSADTADSTQKA